ncbi:hypothetical protein [Pseudomonas sp.]|uniref:hypothetical protein n=1 Tax=Pseudomonas sp. TaxID=306 RepID=UPI003FD8C76C
MAIDFNDAEAGDAYVFGLLKVVCDKQARARMPKRKVLLKSMPAAVASPEKTKPKSRPAAKARPVIVVAAKPKSTKAQLLVAIDRAVTAGRLSGHDGLTASELVSRGQNLPHGTLVAIGLEA